MDDVYNVATWDSGSLMEGRGLLLPSGISGPDEEGESSLPKD